MESIAYNPKKIKSFSEKHQTATEIASDPEVYERVKQQTHSVSREALKELKARFPQYAKRAEFLPFILCLARATRRCEKTGGVLFARTKLARLLGKHPNNVRLTEFLEMMKRELLPELEWTWYEREKGLCTVITNTGIQELLDNLCIDISTPRVFIRNLRKVTEQAKRDTAKKIQRAVKETAAWRYADQERIADAINNLPYSLYATAEKQFHIAYALAEQFDREIEEYFAGRKEIHEALGSTKKMPARCPQRNYHKSMLLRTRDMWKPFCFPSGRSPRVFGTELTFLRGEMRRALFPEWIDYDLKNCYLAIIAGLFDVPLTQAFLATRKSIWTEFSTFMGIAEEKQAIAKEFLKDAVYSIIFGMTRSDAITTLENELACRGIWFTTSLSHHPIIKEICKTLAMARREIKKAGAMVGAYGIERMRDGEDEAGVLARVMQGFELFIVTACYEMQEREKKNRNNEYTIVLHQHDGFSVQLKEGADAEALRERFSKAVQRKARVFDIDIDIDMKK